jgi:Leucine-rich repeat (LRR) protein
MTSAQSDKLDLSGRQLTAVPPDIWRKTSLRVLNLFRNELTSLPANIAQLRELRTLIIASNQLRALPEETRRITPITNAGCGTQSNYRFA